MPDLSLGTAGAKIIKDSEGFCLKFYADLNGYPTVGWGHLITKKKKYTANTTGDPNDSILTKKEADDLSKFLKLDYTSPISQTKADDLFSSDTSDAVDDVNALKLPSGAKFSQSQFDALVSMRFNCGIVVLKSNDVVTMLKEPKIYPTYADKLSKTESDKCSKLVSKAFSYDESLKERRNKEATLFCSGQQYTHKYPVYSL